MPERVTEQDIELLAELGVEAERDSRPTRSATDERVIAGFEEIERFVREHGRPPLHGEERDIFERLYAVRLDRIRESPEYRALLIDRDSFGLLGDQRQVGSRASSDAETDEELLASLGVSPSVQNEVTNLIHVRPKDEIKSAEEIAQRDRCKDFRKFKPIFTKVQNELQTGIRRTVKYQDNADVRKGDLFVLDGQKVLVAELGDEFIGEHGRRDRRLRVVYDNGTESNLLLRSLQRALNKDKSSRRITTPDLGPLFSDTDEDGDVTTGYMYVLRSKSEHPFIKENREIVHKIGVTASKVKTRVSNAKKDPTYLLADVETVATFKLANIRPRAVEALLHKFFNEARMDLALKDRFGEDVEPREWFMVPLAAIEEAVERLKDGTITDYKYEPKTASIVQVQ